MKIGMLWFDNSKTKAFEQKVTEAANYYKLKYSKRANACYVHPTEFPETPNGENLEINGVRVFKNRSVLPAHFWIGYNEL